MYVSILVVVEAARWVNVGKKVKRAVMVSILVVVEAARWAGEGFLDTDTDSRFNPCCGGSGSLGASGRVFPLITFCFNPCCGGSGSLGPQQANICSLLILVSILVVVEAARWAHSPGIYSLLEESFNPCCGGSGSLGPE